MFCHVQKLLKGQLLFLTETGGEVLTSKSQGDLPHAGITETAATHRNRIPVGLFLHGIAIQDRTSGITDIKGNRSTTPVDSRWAIHPHEWLPIAMAQC